ncbi:MAG: secF [Proteobacteria bacterium]|nr:secF [Pseudomonadota bacterium]
MEFFRIRKDIPFMKYALIFNVISVVTFLLAVFFLVAKGLHFSVEFTGGTLVEVTYQQPPQVDEIRAALEKGGFVDAQVQNFGTARDFLIRLPASKGLDSARVSEKVMGALSAGASKPQLRRIRFEWRFAVSAIIANMHDVVIILGFFAFFQWEFSLPVLAAVLAILGYSVNESVVVFDRIRENFRKMRKATVPEIINNAITRTMSRTIITHGSTQMVVLAMLLFGGPSLFYFALALTIGILFGIYSSVLVSSPLVMWLGVSREQFIKPKKEKEEAVV